MPQGRRGGGVDLPAICPGKISTFGSSRPGKACGEHPSALCPDRFSPWGRFDLCGFTLPAEGLCCVWLLYKQHARILTGFDTVSSVVATVISGDLPKWESRKYSPAGYWSPSKSVRAHIAQVCAQVGQSALSFPLRIRNRVAGRDGGLNR